MYVYIHMYIYIYVYVCANRDFSMIPCVFRLSLIVEMGQPLIAPTPVSSLMSSAGLEPHPRRWLLMTDPMAREHAVCDMS